MRPERTQSISLRIFHWINVPILLLLIWSGLLIYWADQAFIKLPQWLVDATNLHHRLAEGMGWHFFLMWIFGINGLGYVAYVWFFGDWKSKYSKAQRFAYTSAILLGIGSIISGLAIYKPVQLSWLTTLLGGYRWARLEHFSCMVGLALFILIHVIQVLRSGWTHMKSMVAGYVTAGILIFSVCSFFVIQRESTKFFKYPFMLNETLWKSLSSNSRLSSNKPQSTKVARVNGLIGLKETVSSKNYKIEINENGKISWLELSSLYVLPKRNHSVEFMCIEGWSHNIQYAGALFSDFLNSQKLGRKSNGDYYAYVGLATPDGKYYVSIDMESMLHPQTILAWELNGRGLSVNTGFPVRLIIPIKYGIKSLKRIGKISFSDERLPDYWAERGYDWYSGL